ncbi:MAG TPA: peptide deformylase [Blastocatellia bacterium]|jgi:peptide deformylase|nr:peptide deformylase [Blastocatellia bacterium]
MKMKIVQVGEPVLRRTGRALSAEEIRGAEIQRLIEVMRETMRDAPGVGLAAPQVGLSLQLAVIEDPEEFLKDVSPEVLARQERAPVPFHVIINPVLHIEPGEKVEFFEGCLSLSGFAAIVGRARAVRVECLNERAEPITINARGWYARILQHEIDHLNGTVYIDRMHTRSFMSVDNLTRFWKDVPIEQARDALRPSPA